MYRRACSLLLGLVLLLVACSGALASDAFIATLGDFSASGDGNLEKYDPIVEMDIGIPLTTQIVVWPEGESVEQNVWSRAYEEELGIKLNLLYATPDSAEKVNALIAAGDIPDLLSVNKNQLSMLTGSGLINEDLYDVYINNAGEQYRQLVEGVGGPAGIGQCTVNGNMVAFPIMGTSVGEGTPMVYLRTDWMEKLGLSDPTNYEELYAIMKAFVDQDPDGNGEADTVGIAFTKDPWNGDYAVSGLFNAFGAHPLNNFWVDDAANPGQVALGIFQPESKAALAELNKLYDEGIIHKEFAVMDSAAASALYASGKCGVLIGSVWQTWALKSSVDNDPNADWHAVSVPALDGDSALISANYPVNSFIVFKKDFEHPEALMKMINLEFKMCFTDETEIETYQKYIESNDASYAPFQIYPWGNCMPAVKNERAAALIAEGTAWEDLPIYAAAFGKACEEYKAGDRSQWPWFRFFGEESGHLVSGRQQLQGRYYMNRWYGLNTETMAENMSLINDLTKEMVIKMIMGEESVDAFDNYIAKASALGLDTITQEVNDWCDAQ